jgi:hypothetical protein
MLRDEINYQAFLTSRYPELHIRHFQGHLHDQAQMPVIDQIPAIMPPEKQVVPDQCLDGVNPIPGFSGIVQCCQ